MCKIKWKKTVRRWWWPLCNGSVTCLLHYVSYHGSHSKAKHRNPCFNSTRFIKILRYYYVTTYTEQTWRRKVENTAITLYGTQCRYTLVQACLVYVYGIHDYCEEHNIYYFNIAIIRVTICQSLLDIILNLKPHPTC